MNISQIVSLAVYGLTFIFILFGFVFGLWKGLKKASLRILVFLVFLVIATLISQPITKTLLGINITINGSTASISNQLINFITSNETIAGFYQSSPAFAELINVLPIAIINFVTFVLLVHVLGLIGYFVYLILTAIFIKKRKKPYVMKNGKAEVVSDYKYEKKHRLWGGLIGAVQAFILLFVTLMPITAIASTFSDLTNSTEANVAYAIEDMDVNYTPTSKMLREYIPQEIFDVVDSYNSTLFAKISHVGKLDQICFDTLTTVSVDGQTISLRKEINNIANVYDNIGFLSTINFENVDLATLDYNKIESALDALFDSGLLKSVLPDVLDYLLDSFVEEDSSMQVPEEYKRYVNAIKIEYEANKGIETIKSDVYSVFGIIKTLGQSGILNEFKEKTINLDNIFYSIDKDDRIVVTNVISNLLNSNSAKAVLVELLNSGIDVLDEQDATVEVPEIDKTLINWSLVKTELTSIINSVLDVYQNIVENVEGNKISDVVEQPTRLLNLDTDKLTQSLSNILNNLQNSNLLVSAGEQKIYDSLIDLFENSPYSEYVDLTVFKQNSWDEELEYLNSALKNIKNSGVVSVLTQKTINFELVFDKLAYKDSQSNKTYIRSIVEPLLDSKAFARTITNAGFGFIDSFISDNQNQLGENVVLGKIQSEKLSEENEKELVVAFFENLVVYAQDLNIEKFNEDAFKEIVSSNLSRLGSALDTIKASKLFGEYIEEDESVNNGIYENLIDALANNPDYNKFADFEVAKLDDFSWNSELSLLQDAIDTFNSVTLVIEGQEKTLLNAIKDGDDITAIFENISTNNEDIYNIVNPLSESRLMKKHLITIINTLNEKLSEVLDVNIDHISDSTNLSQEKQTIVEVLESVVNLYSSIKDGFSEEILEQNYNEIGTLLNTLMISKINGGIFAGTYDGFTKYLSNSSYGENIEYLLSEYENQEDIDWIEILDVAVASNEYTGGEINDNFKNKLSGLVSTVYADEEYGSIMETLIDIANNITILNSSTTATEALDLMINMFSLLETYNENYQKVNTVVTFIENITGLTEISDLKDITNYTDEKNKFINLKSSIQTFENTTNVENLENLIDSIAQAEFAVNLMEKHSINIEIDEVYKTPALTYIEQNIADEILANKLKNIFAL